MKTKKTIFFNILLIFTLCVCPFKVFTMKNFFKRYSNKAIKPENDKNLISVTPSQTTPITPEEIISIAKEPLLKDKGSQTNNFFIDFKKFYKKERLKKSLEENKKLIENNIFLKRENKKLRKTIKRLNKQPRIIPVYRKSSYCCIP